MLSWEYPSYVVGGWARMLLHLRPRGGQAHVVTPRWKGGEPQESLIADAGAPRARSATRRRALPPAVFRVEPPVMGLYNFFSDAQQTNLNLGEQAQVLYDRVGGFNLIHAHDWLVAFVVMSLKRLRKMPLLATIHATERGRGLIGGEMAQAINGTEWWLAYEAWRVIMCSRFMLDEVRNYFNVPPDKIDIVPNGVDASPFDELAGVDLAEFRARWARPDERIVFNVGRVVQEKGAQVIVEAAPRVLAEMPNTKFIIAGKGSSVDDLKQRAAELGVQD